MKPIFGKAPPLGIRLALAVIASLTLILVDGQTSSMTKARSVMETAVGGLYYLANGPRTVLDGVSSNLVDTNKLLIENKVLREQLREKNADLLLLDQLKVKTNVFVYCLIRLYAQMNTKKVPKCLPLKLMFIVNKW